jgi:hypothetical protein
MPSLLTRTITFGSSTSLRVISGGDDITVKAGSTSLTLHTEPDLKGISSQQLLTGRLWRGDNKCLNSDKEESDETE